MLTVIKAANLGLRFALELGILAALAYWGFRVGRDTPTTVALGLGAPLLAAVVWSLFVSPNAPIRAHGPASLLLELAVFGSAATALYAAGQPRLAMAFALVAATNRVLMALWGQ